MAKAQAIILDELNIAYGGAAEAAGNTFAGAMINAKEAINDVFQEIGEVLAPEIRKVVELINGWVQSEQFKRLKEQVIEFTKKAIEEIVFMAEKFSEKVNDLREILFNLGKSIGLNFESWNKLKKSFIYLII